jgi:hypothetical protein
MKGTEQDHLQPQAAPKNSASAEKKLRSLALLCSIFLGTLMAFQNCGSEFVASPNAGMFSSLGGNCDGVLQPIFETTFHPFLSSTCKACHVPGGIGKGSFASPDSGVAYSAFQFATADKISVYAVNPSHATGVTGPGNQSAIADAKAKWDAAVTSCSGGTGPTTVGPVGTVSTTAAKVIGATAKDITLTWKLDSELASGSGNFGGATFSINIRTSATAATIYYVSNPTLKAGTVPIHVGAVTFKVNGVDRPLTTTYSRLDAVVPVQMSSVLSTATGTIDDTVSATDQIAVSFGTLSTQ